MIATELNTKKNSRIGMTTVEGMLVAMVLIFGTMAVAFVTAVQGNSATVSSLQTQMAGMQAATTTVKTGSIINETLLPLMNQTTTVREIWETWYKSPQANQDRFEPAFPVVNQGDTIAFTLIDNDTVAHDLVIGPPYNIVINATVPGLVNDLTKQVFKSPALNNSPGVVVSGTPGNVTATYSFVAKYAGVFEFVCTYHAQVGMIGYLTVLPNAAYTGKPVVAGQPGASSSKTAVVSMLAGAGTNTSIPHSYSPDPMTVVIGVNNTVSWVNNDSSPHTITANDGSFGSGNIAPGSAFTFTFTKPGTYQYHCLYHPWMVGTVIVKSG